VEHGEQEKKVEPCLRFATSVVIPDNKVLDFIIIAKKGYYSFQDVGLNWGKDEAR
jgi:hypothetical protein